MYMTCNVIIDKHTEEVFISLSDILFRFVMKKKIKFKNKKKCNIL